MFYHQVINGKNLAQEAAAIRTRKVSVRDIPRGEILNRNGIPLTELHGVGGLLSAPTDNRCRAGIGRTGFSVTNGCGKVTKDIKRAARRGSFLDGQASAG